MGLNKSLWTDELRSRVKDLWTTHSALQISGLLGLEGHSFTRNSIIGLVKRMGLNASDKTKDHKEAKRHRGTPKKRTRRNRQGDHHAVSKIVAWGSGLRVITSRMSAEAYRLRCVDIECLTTLSDVIGCRYPAGDGHPFLFCNGKQQDNSSYCTAHHALCRTAA